MKQFWIFVVPPSIETRRNEEDNSPKPKITKSEIGVVDLQADDNSVITERQIMQAIRMTDNFITVSQISLNTRDVNPFVPGIQIYSGTEVTCSASALSPVSESLSWQWSYTVNGSSEKVFDSGIGSKPFTVYNYKDTDVGASFNWRLRVNDFVSSVEVALTIEVVAPAINPGEIFFEAEAGGITDPFVVTDGAVSQPIETDMASGGRASYSFSVTNMGTYVVQALVDAPVESEHTFLLNIDAEPEGPAMAWDVLPGTSGFEPRFVSWRGSGPQEKEEITPKFFTLSAGQHQLVVRGASANTRLDKFIVVKVPTPPQNLRVVPGF